MKKKKILQLVKFVKIKLMKLKKNKKIFQKEKSKLI